MKSTLIYRGWKMDVSSLMVPNLGPWFNSKRSQLFAQSSYHRLSDLLQERVGQVGHFRMVL
jgi:hypothetical protein